VRSDGLINFVLITSATACLFGVVTKTELKQNFEPNFNRSVFTLPPDTPLSEDPEPADLPYKFRDDPGASSLLEKKSKLYLQQPENIKTKVEYDPETGNYNIEQKMGQREYRPDTYMSKEEYRDYMFKKQMREYWRSRVSADDLNERPRQGLIPKLQVNSELFDRIFGGNTVDIKPNGTAELIFGLNRNVNRNPAIPQRQQKVTNFDFNMRIQLNLIGKIGDKLKVTTNYNTEASFDWENQVKLDYTGYEDDIIKKIEAGNVTLPLNSSLISGSQTLFGFKTELQFGRLRATTVFSQQKGQKQEITVQGGAQMQQFSKSADDYEQNRHYFLGHYFRDNYDGWMNTLPVISTPIVITKIEVYLLGINGSAEQSRNVVAFEDLGEDIANVYPGLTSATEVQPGFEIQDNTSSEIPSNDANNLYALMTNSVNGLIANRKVDQVSSILSTASTATNANNAGNIYMDASRDYNIIRNARRLNASEYFINTRTGFISLNQQLNNEQSLAVSYQYTYRGQTYQVGEFSDNIPENDKFLVTKLLKSAVVNVKHPSWQLMMKNVYAIGAYNLNPQDFKLDVFYNNIETGVDVPYLPAGKNINGRQLIRVLGCDRLSVNGDKRPDGVYDFINGYTVSQTNGRAYFPTVEPFGRSLAALFEPSEAAEAEKYVFNELYDSTKTAASFIQSKNRFRIKGSYRSSSGSEIALNAINIPQGAVVVTANGVALAENSDYTVDYSLGRVKIINEGILNSGATVKVSLESNSLFSVQQKSLWGTRLDYKAGRNLTLGGTFLRFNERPLTQKVSIGSEPVSNIIAGFDFNHKAEAPFLTRLLDKLPFYSTKEMSTITTRGEIAKLFPGNAAAIKTDGGNSYIDDFEGSIALIDIKGAGSWFLSSIPQGQPKLFPEAALSNTITTGNNRARFNWYNVDAMFTREQFGTTPGHYVSQKLFSNNMWRQVFETELFPGKTPPNGQQVVLPLLDLAFFPSERGPYNYDVKGETGYSSGINRDGSLKEPQSRWGGIMRRLETNDFQAANVEYIQFWLMDPFNEDYSSDTDSSFDKNNLPKGDLYINIGNVSEDIVKDGRMVYENGLPGNSSFSKNLKVDFNNVANIPVQPPIINAFSQDNNDRAFQDVGYDGLTDQEEQARFSQPLQDIRGAAFDQNALAVQRFLNDPSTDQYHFFRGDDYDRLQANTIRRYSRYNNPEGNSPTEAQYSNANPAGGNYPTGATNLPNIEDINRDNTLSEAENYYQYKVRISPDAVNPLAVGTNFIVDAFDGVAEFSGETKTVKWYQFKIPISQFENNVGNLEGFNSIRFMRMYMKGFERPVLLRLARFELVRSDWRRYQFDLKQPGEYIVVDANTTSFDVSAVSLQENANKVPVNYVMPPQIEQTQNVQTTNLVLQNEQALQMRVCDLKDGDSRAIFRNVDLDTRMFNNIKMNVHANQLTDIPLKDGDLNLFFRIGTDYNNNFYEYEVPLKVTPKGLYDPNSSSARREVWPIENEVNFRFSDISKVKQLRNEKIGYYSNLNQISTPFALDLGGYTVTIVGNPNLGTIKSIMVGIRNTKTPDNHSHCAEVWINELRLTDFNNDGGWATTGQMQAKLADLGMLSLAGTYKSPFWGGVESKINERSRETNANWDVSTSVNAGKFFPTGWKITLPVFYNYGQTRITPLFNPLDPDVRFKDLKNIPDDELVKDIESQVVDLTERKGFNLSNVRIEGLKRSKAKAMPWDLGNFSFTYAYNEIYRQSVNVQYNYFRQYRGNIQYAYAIRNPITLRPFTKIKALDKKAFALIKDFHLQLTPNSFGFSTDVNRTYSAVRNRDITSFYEGSQAFDNPTLINKNFTITRNYNFRWDLNKSLKYDYTASNEGRILEPFGESWRTDQISRDSVVNTFLNGIPRNGNLQGQYGENTVFRQQMNLNADLPLNKIPIVDFAKVNYRFSGTFTWNRRPFAASDSIGNIIQNTNLHNVTGNFNLVQLYNKVPYLKKLNNPQSKVKGMTATKGPIGSRDQVQKADTTAKKGGNFKEIAEFMARTLMMVKNISLTFQEDGGQAIPNFKPSSQYGGMDFRENRAPGFLFTTGLHDDRIRQNSAANGWLAQYGSQTTPYIETFRRTYTYRSAIEPHGSLKIELNGTYTRSKNLQEYIFYDPSSPRSENGYLFHESPNLTGSFNISTFSLFQSFKDGKGPVDSKLFDEFLSERFNVSKELGDKNAFSSGLISAGPGSKAYIDGYSDNQQDVLFGAFYRTYVGRDIKNYSTSNIFPTIPLPNWTATWDGLGKLPAFKKTFRGITVRHKYSSMYNINGFSNNILFNTNGNQDQRMPVATGTLVPNFVPFYNLTTVTLRESFEPLIKFDFQFQKPGWSANVETRRDKTTNLNLTGFQIIETKGQEYTIGLGYLYPKLKFKNILIQGKPLESNLTVKLDLSFRKNITVIRQITDGVSVPTGGTNIITMRSSADYQLTQNVTLRLFYDWVKTIPQTSASFPTSNVNGGFSLRITFQ
jgi:cell surface protein SprA